MKKSHGKFRGIFIFAGYIYEKFSRKSGNIFTGREGFCGSNPPRLTEVENMRKKKAGKKKKQNRVNNVKRANDIKSANNAKKYADNANAASKTNEKANGAKKGNILTIGSVDATTGTPKQKKIALVAYFFTMLSFIAPIAYLILKIIFGSFDTIGEGFNTKANYALMIAECVLGIIVIHIPSLLAHKFKFEIPFFLYIAYIIFLYCSIFLGEAQSFYYKIPHWDTILHAMSSLMLGFFGFMFITILNRDEHTLMRLSPFFVSLFAFCFAVTIGAIWEIYEFTMDGLMGFNMQKHSTANGIPLEGHLALADTMKDIIIDAIGAFAASLMGYIGLKQNKKWMIPKLSFSESVACDKGGKPVGEPITDNAAKTEETAAAAVATETVKAAATDGATETLKTTEKAETTETAESSVKSACAAITGKADTPVASSTDDLVLSDKMTV